MPAQKRFKTKYPGVFYIDGKGINGKPERIFYVRYRKRGKSIEEKAGRQYQDDMTPAKASRIRAIRIAGHVKNNSEKRAEKNKVIWTIEKLWHEYKLVNTIKGLRTDENRFKNYIKPAFGKKTPAMIAPLDVERLSRSMSKKRTPQTVAHVLELLRRIINFGSNSGLCDPLKFKIKLPKVSNVVTEVLTDDELKRLLNVLSSFSDRQAAGLVSLALFTGLRRSELFRLQWGDVDLERGFITIRNPKGGKDQMIPINDGAKKILRDHPKTGSVFVFPGRNGGQRTTIQKKANEIKKLAGLPKNFRPMHGYRHVYASMLASSGQVDMYTLQKLLTHKSAAMTQRYAHLRDETLKDASNVASDILKNAMAPKTASVVNIHKKR